MLTGRAVLWARYESEVENTQEEFGLLSDENGQLVDNEGALYEGDLNEVTQNPEDGSFSVLKDVQKKTTERSVLDCVHYNDFRQGMARNQSEVEWKARRAYMNKDQVAGLIGKEKADKITYDTVPEDVKKSVSKEIGTYEGKAEFWEIYCKPSEKVYWLSVGQKEIVLEQEPPIKFKGFWPCVEAYANIEPSSIVPISDYTLLEDLITEVERLTTRIHAAMQAVRTNMAYDASMGTDIEALLSDDLKMIPLKNWPSYKARGGLANSIEALNVEPYIRAIEVLNAAREIALAKFYEMSGSNEVIRGATNPVETATGVQSKVNFTSLRFSVRQKQILQFFSDGVGLLAEIIAEHYSEEKIWDVANGDEIMAEFSGPGPNGEAPPDPRMQLYPLVIGLLRDDAARRYRIEIKEGSMVALDERADRQERVDLLASVGSFLEQMAGWVEKYPETGNLTPELLKFTIRTYKGGKELEPVFQALNQAVINKAKNAQNQPPQDPKIIEAQTKVQLAQMDMQKVQQQMQFEAQKAAMDAEIAHRELAIKEQTLVLENNRLQLEAAKVGADIQLSHIEFAQKDRQIQAGLMKEAMDTRQAALENRV
jgi:hypothetical protein